MRQETLGSIWKLIDHKIPVADIHIYNGERTFRDSADHSKSLGRVRRYAGRQAVHHASLVDALAVIYCFREDPDSALSWRDTYTLRRVTDAKLDLDLKTKEIRRATPLPDSQFRIEVPLSGLFSTSDASSSELAPGLSKLTETEGLELLDTLQGAWWTPRP